MILCNPFVTDVNLRRLSLWRGLKWLSKINHILQVNSINTQLFLAKKWNKSQWFSPPRPHARGAKIAWVSRRWNAPYPPRPEGAWGPFGTGVIEESPLLPPSLLPLPPSPPAAPSPVIIPRWSEFFNGASSLLTSVFFLRRNAPFFTPSFLCLCLVIWLSLSPYVFFFL